MTIEEAIAYGKRVINLGLNDETQEFCELAIKALEQQRWIPVSERLPKIVEWYSTSIKLADGTERVTISWFDGVSFKAEVKAWKPLPLPYKKSEDEG